MQSLVMQIHPEMLVDQLVFFIAASETDTNFIEDIYPLLSSFENYKIISEDDLKPIFIRHKNKHLDDFMTYIAFIGDNCNSYMDAYLRLDLIEFIQTLCKMVDKKYTSSGRDDFKFVIGTDYHSVVDFINKGDISVYTDYSEIIEQFRKMYEGADVTNAMAWVRLLAWDILYSSFEEIQAYELDDLTFNPYLSAVFNFSTEERVKIALNQSISRKLSGKWGNKGEEMLKHFGLVRSQLREFDLKMWDGEHLWHYEIKSMPKGTMRGAEEKKFFGTVIPGYQCKYPKQGFKYGGLYHGRDAVKQRSKIEQTQKDNPDVTFLADPDWVVGGSILWEELTGFPDALSQTYNELKETSRIFYSSIGENITCLDDIMELKTQELVRKSGKKNLAPDEFFWANID